MKIEKAASYDSFSPLPLSVGLSFPAVSVEATSSQGQVKVVHIRTRMHRHTCTEEVLHVLWQLCG